MKSASTMQKFGRYFLLDAIGEGGMAEVYRARLSGAGELNRLVAIKKIRSQDSNQSEAIRMFKREMAVTSALNHPNIISVYDYGEIDGCSYLAMEYLGGRSLHELQTGLKKHGRVMPRSLSLFIAEQVAAALAYAHEFQDPLTAKKLEVVHRDISPHNIFITFSGKVKVIDYGVAKYNQRSHQTEQGMVFGKISYMSPEQLKGMELDGRSDIFSLGIILWEMLMDRRLFDGENMGVIVNKIIDENPGSIPNPAEFHGDISEHVDLICTKALQKQREQRFQSAREFQMELRKLLVQDQIGNEVALGVFLNDIFANARAADSAHLVSLNRQTNELLKQLNEKKNLSDATIIIESPLAKPKSDSSEVRKRSLLVGAFFIFSVLLLSSQMFFRGEVNPSGAGKQKINVRTVASTKPEIVATKSLATNQAPSENSLGVADRPKSEFRENGIERIFSSSLPDRSKEVFEPFEKKLRTERFYDVFLMDSVPWLSSATSPGSDLQIVFANTLCTQSKLGLHLKDSQVSSYLETAKCLKLLRNPWMSEPTDTSRWALATQAFWSGHRIEVGGAQKMALVGFTDNKSMPDNQGRMRRGPGAYSNSGFVTFRMEGGPVDVAMPQTKPYPSHLSDLNDGFYMPFVTLSLLDISSSENSGLDSRPVDLGPIVWPTTGYRRWNKKLKGWQQASVGVRHPHGFLDKNGHLYVFYVGYNGVISDDGEKQNGFGGVYVARAAIKDGLKPESFRCGKDFVAPCLPQGLSLETDEKMAKSLSLQTSKDIRPIIETGDGGVTFVVAAVEGNPNKYLGLLQTYDGETNRIKLYQSNNLVAWDFVKELLSEKSPYDQLALIYPALANVLNGTTDSVNENDFYLLGTSFKGCPPGSWPCHLNRMRIKKF